MSLDKESFIVYGFKFDESQLDVIDDHWDELFEEEPYASRFYFDEDDTDEVIVEDTMCGQYAYAGLKLSRITEYSKKSTKEDVSKFENLQEKLEEKMKTWPDYLLEAVKDMTPALYSFQHVY